MKEQFDLVFKGELVPGCDLEQTKKNIANLFKIGPDKVAMLFSGRAVTLKKNLDAQTANTYRVAIKKAGARVGLIESAVIPPSSDNSKNTGHSTNAGNTNEIVTEEKSTVARVEQSECDTTTNRPLDRSMTLQTLGEDLLRPEERRAAITTNMNLDHLSLRQQQGNLVDDSELSREIPLEIEVPAISLGQEGDMLLSPEERSAEVPVDEKLDKVDFSLAGLDERLVEPKKVNAIVPNTDHIQIIQDMS